MARVAPAWIGLAAATFLCGTACAMSAPASSSAQCRVVDGEKLPARSGGADALCAAIERAVSARVPGLAWSVQVQVLSPSMLTGVLTAGGRPLPEQKFARMDGEIDGSAFERFASALADQAAKSRN